jgi:thiamine pyrophosphate-dependent acetolactate synthase large subunit-like protein
MRYEKIAEALGCYGEYIDTVDEIIPALNRAQAEVNRGRVAVVNVKTDFRARAQTVRFASYAT